MQLDKLAREIIMNCPTCGGTQFKCGESNNEDHQLVECASCGKQLSRAELLHENSENIDENVNEIKKLAVKEIEKELRKSLKSIKIKL